MITQENICDVLYHLGYRTEPGSAVYAKRWTAHAAVILVDCNAGEIIYPEDRGFIVNKRTTCNFSDSENFVVLECVTRLLDKGYRPESIELEREWSLGHSQKSGRADICITGDDGETLAIVECKTAGQEFSQAWAKTQLDGGQLFSYWQQERATRWLVLYSADWDGCALSHEVETVSCEDDANFVSLAQKDNSIHLYVGAGNAQDLFSVWDETYGKAAYGEVLLGDDAQAYHPRLRPLRKADLRPFTAKDAHANKIVNRFEEILRHNNVSDKENAFNRLIALFIAKLDDELGKMGHDEVEFQYKQGSDTYESFQDRLQRLYQEGMEKFMREDVLYVPENYAEKLIDRYTGQQRKNLIAELNDTLRRLKFYTNSEFAFKDVHNEELFQQNSRVLVEVVQLFQPYRLVDDSSEHSRSNQFLGDLFERLLNQGFKQNEGQFFTPNPITRFIWRSLPVEHMVAQGESVHYPRVIDYACGAGHFLTEGFEEISRVALPLDDLYDDDWVRGRLVGIEKDYRLARVSRVSLWMHGAGEGDIIFGDGLDNYPGNTSREGVEDKGFDVLVANPPYSVKAFKPYLTLRHNDLGVLDKITETGSEIETAFVERATQLVKPNGYAAIILPTSILDKSLDSFIAARDELLRAFSLRAIVRFGAGTFGATGTNTVVLFMQRYDEPPKRDDACADSVDAVFASRDLSGWVDDSVLDSYLKKVGCSLADYRAFVQSARTWHDFLASPHLRIYAELFSGSSELKDLRKRKTYKKMDEAGRLVEEDKLFYGKYQPDERVRLLVYALVHGQRTLVVNVPTDAAERKEFLGYDWSNRKGDEGIKILSDGGALYSDDSDAASSTVSRVVKAAFAGEEPDVPELSQSYFFMDTADLIDFDAKKFDMALRAPRHLYEQRTFSDGVSVKRLGDIAGYVGGQVSGADVDIAAYVTTESMLKGKGGITSYEGTAPRTACTAYEADDVLTANIRPYLKKVWLADRAGACSKDVLVLRVKNVEEILPAYLYLQLWQDDFFDYSMSTAKGIKMPRGDKDKILDYRIPIPNIEEQKRLVAEFKKLTGAIEEKRAQAADAKASVQRKFEEIAEGPKSSDWSSGAIADFALDVRYGTVKPAKPEGAYTYLRMNNITDDGRLDLSNTKRIDLKGDELANSEVRYGDLLFNRTNSIEKVGKACVFRLLDPMVIAGYLVRVRFAHAETAEYISGFLNSVGGKRLLFDMAKGSINQANISAAEMGSIRIDLPPLALQQEFADFARKADAHVAQLDQEAGELERKRTQLVESFVR